MEGVGQSRGPDKVMGECVGLCFVFVDCQICGSGEGQGKGRKRNKCMCECLNE